MAAMDYDYAGQKEKRVVCYNCWWIRILYIMDDEKKESKTIKFATSIDVKYTTKAR